MKGWGETAFAVFGAAAALLGCSGVQVAAPPAEGPVTDAAVSLGFEASAPARGRQVFVDRCGRCHGRINPDKRTAEEWKDILPTMSRKARLSGPEASDLRAYVMGARQAADAAGASGGTTPAAQ